MRHALALTLLLAATPLAAQQEIQSTITEGTQVVRIAVPFPELNPPGAAAPQPVDANVICERNTLGRPFSVFTISLLSMCAVRVSAPFGAR